MPGLDIGNAADFSRIAQGTLGNLVDLFGGRDPRDWDIQEASYNGVKFHVFELSTIFNGVKKVNWNGGLSNVTDQSGRRKVIFKYPYVDGQTTDDLGREGETFD